MGGTYRFGSALPPLPALKAPMSEKRIALYRPKGGEVAPQTPAIPFFEVVEARCSLRARGKQALSAEQLGTFLYYCARVKDVQPAVPGDRHSYEASFRPCASGGAMHELELYLTITRCAGIPAGFYHYDPLAHVLEHLADLGPAHESLLNDGRAAAGMPMPPDVLITLAARFQRGAWKYQAVAYALTLKNVGSLYQQMYLVATSLKLAPCALGSGNSDLFAGLAGLDYYAETSVGEFLLSGS